MYMPSPRGYVFIEGGREGGIQILGTDKMAKHRTISTLCNTFLVQITQHHKDLREMGLVGTTACGVYVDSALTALCY